MIVTRTPFRVSFCGGGTDIPSYYRENGGAVLSTSIDKYVYITMVRSFHSSTILKYSTVENVESIDDIKHPIFRELLKKHGVSGVEINSTSNIPAGTGLGSSSAFTVGLANAIGAFNHTIMTKKMLAEEACDIEINRLNEPIGKQDQYASAYGGLNFIRFNKDDTVDVEPISLDPEDKKEMFGNLMMFYIGGTRSASEILKGYGKNKSKSNYGQMVKLAERLRYELNKGNISSLGKILDEGWQIKRTISSGITNPVIDDMYDKAIDNGAVGGKLLGAGGNGFMLFYVEKDSQENVRKALSGYREMDFTFDEEGSKVVYNDEM